MFSKSFFASALVLAFAAHAQAHAIIAPALGVAGTPARSDVKRPSTAAPCGNGVNVASTLAAATPVQAAADGTFTVTVTNFNAGADGSRSVTASVSPDGTGVFAAATVSKNGVANPTSNGSDQVVAALPAGTKCTGGAGNVCVVSFKTTAGFGNCVAVAQGAATAAASTAVAGTAAAGNTTAAAGTAAAGVAAAGTATAGTAAAGTRKGRKGNKGANRGAAATAAGTRAARAWIHSIEERTTEELATAKRSIISWVWA